MTERRECGIEPPEPKAWAELNEDGTKKRKGE